MRLMQLISVGPALDPGLLALRDLKNYGNICIDVPPDRAIAGMAVDVHSFLRQFGPAYRTSVEIDNKPAYKSQNCADRLVKIRVRGSLKKEHTTRLPFDECRLYSQGCIGEVFVSGADSKYTKGESVLSPVLSGYLPEPARKTTLFLRSSDTPSNGIPFYTIYQDLPRHAVSLWEKTTLETETFRSIRDSVAWHTAGSWVSQALFVMGRRKTPKEIGKRFGMGTEFVKGRVEFAMERALSLLYCLVNRPMEINEFLKWIECPPGYSGIFLKSALSGVAKVSANFPDPIVGAYNARYETGARLTPELLARAAENSAAHSTLGTQPVPA